MLSLYLRSTRISNTLHQRQGRIHQINNKVLPFTLNSTYSSNTEDLVGQQMLQMMKIIGYSSLPIMAVCLGFLILSTEEEMSGLFTWVLGKLLTDILCMYWILIIDGVYDLTKRRIKVIWFNYI